MSHEAQEQFSRVYDEYIEKIYRFVYIKVSSTEVAQDITSKVFLKAWESYQRDQKINDFAAFLYRIARNAVTDHYREKGKVKWASMDAVAQVVDQKVALHEKAVINAEIDRIRLVIQNIRQEYQDVIIWHYLEDMPIEKIATIIGKPPGTIRVMMHRGLKSLKDELAREA